MLSLVVLLAFRPLRNLSARIGRSYAALDFEYQTGHGTMGPILSGLEQAGLTPEVLSIRDEAGDGGAAGSVRLRRLHIEVLGQPPQLAGLDELIAHLQERPEVRLAILDRERLDDVGDGR